MSLMRTAFWLGLLIMVLPIDQDPADKENTPKVSAWQAIGAAQTVYSDISGFCSRNPSACETGEAMAKTFTNKTKASVKVIYDYLSEPEAGTEQAPAADTLTPEDRAIDAPDPISKLIQEKSA